MLNKAISVNLGSIQTFHKMSPKHLHLFAGRIAISYFKDTRALDQMRVSVGGMGETQLRYSELTADKVLVSGARV